MCGAGCVWQECGRSVTGVWDRSERKLVAEVRESVWQEGVSGLTETKQHAGLMCLYMYPPPPSHPPSPLPLAGVLKVQGLQPRGGHRKGGWLGV